jgi:hypothetical protein
MNVDVDETIRFNSTWNLHLQENLNVRYDKHTVPSDIWLYSFSLDKINESLQQRPVLVRDTGAAEPPPMQYMQTVF